MTLKSMLPVIVGVIVAMAVWELGLRKMIVRDTFEEDFDPYYD